MYRWLLGQGVHAKLLRPQRLVEKFQIAIQNLAELWGITK